MATSWWELTLTGIVMVLVQLMMSWPWSYALMPELRRSLREPLGLVRELLVGVFLGSLLGLWSYAHSDPATLAQAGRFFMSLLHLQIAANLLALVFALGLYFWPKGSAIALASYFEGLRQPTYWFLFLITASLMAISPVIPYFTFGEDLKMMREICFAFTMIAPAFYGVLVASMSISDEIEGRTAVTLLSKPISRRQFLLGKFLGIAFAALTMTIWLGWLMVWLKLAQPLFDPPAADAIVPYAVWPANWANQALGNTGAAQMLRGMFMWVNDAGADLPGLIMGFCQVMILIACTVSLATRLPFVLTLVAVLLIFVLGHLTAIITVVTQESFVLVGFMAKLFHTVLPGLDQFDVGHAVTRDAPLPPLDFALYTLYVAIYGVLYTAIALLVGLVLFEDRDLA